MALGKNISGGEKSGRIFLLPRACSHKTNGASIKASKDEPVAISETEERMADFLDAAQEMKPLSDAKPEEALSVSEGVIETTTIIPETQKVETVADEMPRKKRRGRKWKRAMA